MATIDDSRLEIPDAREEEDLPGSTLQLRLAAGIVNGLVERNGGCDAAAGFWDDDSIAAVLDRDEYLDPEFWDPDDETVPEMAQIYENIFECG